MKKYKGFSSTVTTIAIVVAAFLIITAIVLSNILNSVNYSKYDLTSIIEPNADNGYIGDHVKGNPDAPIVIIEYGDYECPLCAESNPYINKAVEESDGKLAVVYRTYLLGYHLNSKPAAYAAEAAGLQGYWKPFADKLFSEQAEWEYGSKSELTVMFKKYFEEVSKGEGDLEKFEQDMNSESVSKKVSFDLGISRRVDIPGTPALYFKGQYIDWTNKEGSEIKAGNETIYWDKSIVLEGLPGLLLKITGAELASNN